MTKENLDRADRVQHEELGRFVQAFEAILLQARMACTYLIQAPQSQTSIILHHQALSAKPLFEITLALFCESATRITPPLDDQQSKALSGVLSQMSGDFGDLVSVRNKLLHGTWWVGFPSRADGETINLQVEKFKVVTLKGEVKLDALPETVEKLRTFRSQCTNLSKFVFALAISSLHDHKELVSMFAKENERWIITKEVQVHT